MGRKFKNSDDCTYFADRANDSRLEKLRIELIPDYAKNKYRKKRKNYNSKPLPKKNRKPNQK